MVLVALLLPPAARATERGHFVGIDAAAYVTNVGTRLGTPAAYQSLVSTISGLARVRRGWNLSSTAYFEPTASVAVPWRSAADGDSKTFTAHLALPVAWQRGFFRLRIGPGLLTLWTRSEAAAIELNNGTATSTFYIPGGDVFAFLLTVDLGIEAWLSRHWGIFVESQWVGLLSRERRGASLAMGVGYRW